MHRVLALALCGCFLACVSPTDPLGRQDALEEAQQRYTDLVRWGELEKASQFVAPELRGPYVALAKDFEGLRITNFEISDIVYGDDDARVTVFYEGYVVAQLVERSAREQQEWYREEGLKNVWRVRPQLDQVMDTLHGRTAQGN